NVEVHLHADDLAAHHFANLHTNVGQGERARQRSQPIRVEPNLKQRAERHVPGDAAERIEDRDPHQKRYDAPLPVLNTTTSALFGIRPAATSCLVTASAHPPSGAASTPLARDSSSVAARIASSLTPSASPLLSRNARRMSRSPSGPGTRRPLACVVGFSHGVAFSSPAANARTIGAHPSACATTMCGIAASLGSRPPSRISANTFHMPINP